MKSFKELTEARKKVSLELSEYIGDTDITEKILYALISKYRGKIEVPVLVRNDIEYLYVVKGDLLRYIKGAQGDSQASLYIVFDDKGVLRLGANT